MAKQTQKLGKSAGFAKTMRQGAAMLSGKDIPNYTLTFEDQPKNISERERTFWAPTVTLGRNSNCTVQYGDNFNTVSREHAMINTNPDKTITVHQLSQTNPTLINGQPIGDTQQLQPGDTIQLSYQGPKLRFISTPIHKTTASMKFTQRLSEFGSQALRPYKRAIAALSVILLLVSSLGGYALIKQGDTIEDQADMIADSNVKISDLNNDLLDAKEEAEKTKIELRNNKSLTNQAKRDLVAAQTKNEKEIQDLNRLIAQERVKIEELENVNVTSEAVTAKVASETEETSPTNSDKSSNFSHVDAVQAAKELEEYEENIYFIYPHKISWVKSGVVEEVLKKDVNALRDAWSGTGFLGSDRYLYTARHVLTPWRFDELTCELMAMVEEDPFKLKSQYGRMFFSYLNLANQEFKGLNINVTFKAVSASTKDEFTFSLNRVEFNDSEDIIKCPEYSPELDYDVERPGWKNEDYDLTTPFKHVPSNAMSTDWARVKINRTGKIKINTVAEKELLKGMSIYGLGYSRGFKLQNWTSLLRSTNDYKRTQFSFEPVFLSGLITQRNQTNNMINITNMAIEGGSSGGPLFAKINDEWEVIGIVSNGTNNVVSLVPVNQIF